MPKIKFSEEYLSQIPALRLLVNLGYQYLTHEQVSAARGGGQTDVLLENILRERLKNNNHIHYKGKEYPFSDENIDAAIRKLKVKRAGGLQKTNQEVYDLLTLGTALPQGVEGASQSGHLYYVDWENPANNVFHVAAEFSVECTRNSDTIRPDIVLFVNGIPLAIIECKAPTDGVERAVSQTIRNQGDEYAPQLFAYAQLLLAVNKTAAKYGTVGTADEFWSVWQELEDDDGEISACVDKPLGDEGKDALFNGRFQSARAHFDQLEAEAGRLLTEQDRCLYGLCRPQRLLELAYGFTLFEGGEKKIARYQQFFLVRAALRRVKCRDENGRRAGGVVWHTQGSGKSITMVMLVRALALYTPDMRIILVTDRKDLDRQLGNTFLVCGLDKKRAASGKDLLRHIQSKVSVITTLVNKFEKAFVVEKYVDDSPNIVVLVDESHRTNFGTLAAGMRRMLPKASYIGFTGTPLLKKHKNSFERFGGLINPSYPVRQAVQDKAVLPLLYEGRHVVLEQEQEAIDLWFARHTEDLNGDQKADLKRKYARAGELNRADRVIYMRAFDIGRHFQSNWQDTGFKAQLVSPDKASALKYHVYLQDVGAVSSAVIISPPDTREGHTEVGRAPDSGINEFWKRMMQQHGNEERYTQSIISQFKNEDHPEILIVVDKLITGFDAPRNTVLYLCRKLREHTLLQAIARVNRLHEGKEYGYVIDYNNILRELNSALGTYEELSGFDERDLVDFLVHISREVSKLPQCYSDLWDVFREVSNSVDEERYEQLLTDDERRGDFYDRLLDYTNILAIALSSEQFLTSVDDETLQRYKHDLEFFQKLKASVKFRYAESINYSDYNLRIKKLLDVHIRANEVIQINEPVNIFDDTKFANVKEQRGIYKKMSPAASGDAIAHAVKRSINEMLDKDPAFYEKFSKLIQAAIDDFRKQHISDLEYLQRTITIRDDMVLNPRDDVPENIRGDDEACGYFGAVKAVLGTVDVGDSIDEIAVQTALAFKRILNSYWKVDFWNDVDAQRKIKIDMEGFLCDEVKDEYQVSLPWPQIDEVFNRLIDVAKSWKP